jgi:hypothetical protein
MVRKKRGLPGRAGKTGRTGRGQSSRHTYGGVGKPYPVEFRLRAVKEAVETDATPTQVARVFGTATSGSVRFWVPDVPAGCKVPVIHLSNGTTLTCADYAGILERLASLTLVKGRHKDRPCTIMLTGRSHLSEIVRLVFLNR